MLRPGPQSFTQFYYFATIKVITGQTTKEKIKGGDDTAKKQRFVMLVL